MFDNLEIIRMANGLARHAGARQDVTARNIANADTPGYRASDAVAFGEIYESDMAQGMRATRAAHIAASDTVEGVRLFDVPGESSPNGNTVALEAEMMRSAEIRHQHDMATSIYRTSLDILRTSLGRR
jgi:flagellar basal-body rod protein FlgB